MASYVCRYCRQPSEAGAAACPRCGAPLDVRELVSRSGWEQQPPIRDMAHIQFGQSRLQVEGTQVPVADFNLRDPEWIYFSHHVLLWADASTRLTNASLAGAWDRAMAGLPLVLLEARGPGHVALSENHAGDLIALPLQPGQSIWTREHRFLAATGAVDYTWDAADVWYETGTGNDREYHYPLGRYGDVFTATDGPGLLLMHAPGDTFVRDLAPGETILIQPSSLLYCDVSVQRHLHLEYPSSAAVTYWRQFSLRTVWVRLIGPGRVAVASVFTRPEGAEQITGGSYATVQRW